MHDRLQTLTQSELSLIHDSSLTLLREVGVAFNEPEALEIFKEHGFKVEDSTVRFTAEQIEAALKTAPSRFRLTARDPKKSVDVGEDDYVFVPTYGPPFVCAADGQQRLGTLEDYDTVCKLVQTSKYIDVNGFKHVAASNVPAQTSHLDMLLSNMILCDKPFMGSADSRQAARETMAMASLVFGGQDRLRNTPVTVGLINSLSPLQFSSEMAGSIIEYARFRQPIIVANMIMAGASGPIRLASLYVLMNAEILAGLTLAQLVGPGTPVIYGTTSCPLNMKTGAASVGAPETAMISAVATQMARYYNLPCRTGGSLTDSLVPDAQALAEGALILSTAVRCGANFILHACGMMGTYIGLSFEKWLIDEELCGQVRRMLKPVSITPETVDLDSIAGVGIGGNYLMQPATLTHCRTEFFMGQLFNKHDHASWTKKGARRLDVAAADLLVSRLGGYEKPEIDPSLETALAEFVTASKNQPRTA